MPDLTASALIAELRSRANALLASSGPRSDNSPTHEDYQRHSLLDAASALAGPRQLDFRVLDTLHQAGPSGGAWLQLQAVRDRVAPEALEHWRYLTGATRAPLSAQEQSDAQLHRLVRRGGGRR